MIENQLRCLIAEILWVEPETILLASTLEESGMDSLDQVELIMSIEEDFEIKFADDEIENLKTFQQLVDYVKSKTENE